MSRDKGTEKCDVEENLLHAKIEEQNWMPIYLRSLVSAQKPETLTLSEIDFDFITEHQAAGLSVSRWQAHGLLRTTPHSLCLGKCSYPTLGDRFKRPDMPSWMVAEYTPEWSLLLGSILSVWEREYFISDVCVMF